MRIIGYCNKTTITVYIRLVHTELREIERIICWLPLHCN